MTYQHSDQCDMFAGRMMDDLGWWRPDRHGEGCLGGMRFEIDSRLYRDHLLHIPVPHPSVGRGAGHARTPRPRVYANGCSRSITTIFRLVPADAPPTARATCGPPMSPALGAMSACEPKHQYPVRWQCRHGSKNSSTGARRHVDTSHLGKIVLNDPTVSGGQTSTSDSGFALAWVITSTMATAPTATTWTIWR